MWLEANTQFGAWNAVICLPVMFVGVVYWEAVPEIGCPAGIAYCSTQIKRDTSPR